MNRRALVMGVLCAVVTAAGLTYAQDQPSQTPSYELRLRVVSSLSGNHRAVPAVVWLEPFRHYVMTYTALSRHGPRIAIATSQDLLTWRRVGLARFMPWHGLSLRD